MAQFGPGSVRDLGRRIEGMAVLARIVIAEGDPGLHGIGGDPVIVDPRPGDVVRAGEGRLDGLGVAHGILEGEVAVGAVIDQRCAVGPGRGGGGDRRQNFVVHLDQFRGVLGLRQRFRNDEGHPGADALHFVLGERRGGPLDRLALQQEGDDGHAGNASETRRFDVRAGKDGGDAGGGFGGRGVDGLDPGIGVRRAQHIAVGHPGKHHVVHIAPLAGQEFRIFLSGNRLPNAEFHCLFSLFASGDRFL